MKFGINDFISTLDQGRVTNYASYSVLINGPQRLGGKIDEIDIMFRCDSVTEPGRNIITTTDAYSYGLPLSRASGSSFSEIDMTVLLSEDEREKLYFERWQDLMVGPYRTGVMRQDMYDVGYFNDYVGNIQIFRSDAVGNVSYKATLRNAFPVVVGDISLDWDNNSIVKLPVRFWFQYYMDEPTELETIVRTVRTIIQG